MTNPWRVSRNPFSSVDTVAASSRVVETDSVRKSDGRSRADAAVKMVRREIVAKLVLHAVVEGIVVRELSIRP